MSLDPCSPSELAELHAAYCTPGLESRKFTHEQLWTVLGSIADEAEGLRREEIGCSAEGRPLYAVHFGRGPTRVLLWSQMHGDEPSHTMALADLFAYWAREPDDARVARLRDALTIVAVPMLNPDGAARFRRPNAQGIDLNQDARAWVTPELRALRDLYLRFQPDFGFSLHDQNARTRVGTSDRLTALALVATPSDEAGTDDDARLRAKRLCGVIRRAADPLVGGHVARFSEEYDPLAIDEYMQRSGTSTVLLESGSWPDDPEKQYLRTLSFVCLFRALESIADGSYAEVPLAEYDSLEENDRDVFDVVIRGGVVVVPGLQPYRADVGINFAAPLDERDGTVAMVGDLADWTARKTICAEGLYVHPRCEALSGDGTGPLVLAEGNPASFVVCTGPEPTSETVLAVRDGVVEAGEAGS